MRGQTNKFFKPVFRSRKSKSRNVSYVAEQTSFQFFKNCRSSKSRNSKHIEVWSRKSKRIKWGRTTNYNFSKIVGRVSQENRNISMRGQTNKFFKQVFLSGKSRNSKRIKWGRTNKLQFFKNVGRVSQENRNISRRGQTNNFFKQFFGPESR